LNDVSRPTSVLSSAILSDITTPANRAKALAHVGIAFAICFCIGPPIGAYFASGPVALGQVLGMELNIYAVPAILTLVLLVAETLFLGVALPETRRKKLGRQGSEKAREHSTTDYRARAGGDSVPVRPSEQRIKMLKTLRMLHFLFLIIFSGIEFTLTFLTFDRT
jgi:MFS family permease